MVDRIRNTRYNKRYKELGMEIERNIVIILKEKQILREWMIDLKYVYFAKSVRKSIR